MIRLTNSILILLALIGFSATAQQWRVLPSSPTATSFRHDDLFFIHPDTGWVCNVDGKIFKTTDGGTTWKTITNMPNTSFRCLGFVNAQKGWAGNLGVGRWSPTIDTMPLYQTTDGGASWNAVTNIQGTLPQGICGISVVNDSVVYAVGRVGSPAYVLKTTNAGASWTSINMNAEAFQLIDCKFFSVDTGIVIGGFPGPQSRGSYRVFYTTNGGINWQTVATGIDSGYLAWKIFFVNRKLGYISIENESRQDSVFFLKTTDGGLTWKQGAYFQSASYGAQGIGFVNDSIGWCAFISGDTKQTNDGGKTWTNTPAILQSLNRIRYIGPNLAYGVGQRVWKYSMFGTGMSDLGLQQDEGYILTAFPNPFIGEFTLKYRITENGHVAIRLYDFSGRPIKTLVDDDKSAGEYKFEVKLNNYFQTHFYIVLQCNGHIITEKAMMTNH